MGKNNQTYVADRFRPGSIAQQIKNLSVEEAVTTALAKCRREIKNLKLDEKPGSENKVIRTPYYSCLSAQGNYYLYTPRRSFLHQTFPFMKY